MKPKPRFSRKVWAVTWPVGTAKEWRGEQDPPQDCEPICAETRHKFLHKTHDTAGSRMVWGTALALFDSKAAAEAWLKASDGEKSFVVRSAKVEVF